MLNEFGSNHERGYGTRKECVIAGGGCNFRVTGNPNANGSTPWYEFGGLSDVDKYASIAAYAAESQGVDPRLVMSIMYMETTHGYYDNPLSLFGLNKSILPMNINVDFWGDAFGTREQLNSPSLNIWFGAKMIASNMPTASVSQIATVYNKLNATMVTDYGARVSEIYASQPWKK